MTQEKIIHVYKEIKLLAEILMLQQTYKIFQKQRFPEIEVSIITWTQLIDRS